MSRFYLVNSFTRIRFKGNPAGVVLMDRPLDGEEMRKIAGELRLETLFAEAVGERFRVAYYMGECRVPLCGHDTVALGAVLAHLDSWPDSGHIELITDIGTIALTRKSDGRCWMTQSQPVLGEVVESAFVSRALGVAESIVLSDPAARVVSTGSPFLFARIAHRDVIDALKPDADFLADSLRTIPGGPLGLYVWCAEDDAFEAVYGRCFAPVAGLPEDPVTGSASGALGAYLAMWRFSGLEERYDMALRVTQGVAMGRGGEALVQVTWDGEKVTKVAVGGHAVVVAEGTLIE